MCYMFDREHSDHEVELQYTIDDLTEELDETKKQADLFKKAYDIVMDYFDYLDCESRKEVDTRLKEIGL